MSPPAPHLPCLSLSICNMGPLPHRPFSGCKELRHSPQHRASIREDLTRGRRGHQPQKVSVDWLAALLRCCAGTWEERQHLGWAANETTENSKSTPDLGHMTPTFLVPRQRRPGQGRQGVSTMRHPPWGHRGKQEDRAAQGQGPREGVQQFRNKVPAATIASPIGPPLPWPVPDSL